MSSTSSIQRLIVELTASDSELRAATQAFLSAIEAVDAPFHRSAVDLSLRRLRV